MVSLLLRLMSVKKVEFLDTASKIWKVLSIGLDLLKSFRGIKIYRIRVDFYLNAVANDGRGQRQTRIFCSLIENSVHPLQIKILTN